MKIISLPDVLIGSGQKDSGDVLFYYHIGHQSNYRSKITFRQHCLTFLLSGKKQIFVEDKNVIYDNASCLLFRSGNYLSNEISADGKPYHSILIFFNETALRKIKHKYRNLLTEQPSPLESNLSFPVDAYIQSFRESAREMLLQNDSFSPAMQHLKFEEIMLYLMEKYGRYVVDFFEVSLETEDIRFFQRTIEANAYKNISLDELAFLCHISKSTFKRRFVEVYQESPGLWLRNKRLDYAAELIGISGKSPSEIYHELGFSSLSSFIYSFKKKFGTTPKQYQLG